MIWSKVVGFFLFFFKDLFDGVSVTSIKQQTQRSCSVTFNRIIIAHTGGTRKALLILNWEKTFILVIKVEVNSGIFNPVLFDRGRSFNVFF